VLAASFILFSANVLAQEDDIDAAIEQSRSSSSVRELQAQASTAPPKTDDQHELAIFYHNRGVANYHSMRHESIDVHFDGRDCAMQP
jgi:hypothetical protein